MASKVRPHNLAIEHRIAAVLRDAAEPLAPSEIAHHLGMVTTLDLYPRLNRMRRVGVVVALQVGGTVLYRLPEATVD